MNEPTYTVTPQPLPCVHHQSIKNMIAEAIKNLDEAITCDLDEAAHNNVVYARNILSLAKEIL